MGFWYAKVHNLAWSHLDGIIKRTLHLERSSSQVILVFRINHLTFKGKVWLNPPGVLFISHMSICECTKGYLFIYFSRIAYTYTTQIITSNYVHEWRTSRKYTTIVLVG
jgi:hypothetical protein